MTIYKGFHLTIGTPVAGATHIRASADPEQLRKLAADLVAAKDRARHGVTQAFLAAEQAQSVEGRMRASVTQTPVRRA